MALNDVAARCARATIFNPADFTREGELSIEDLFSFLDEFVAESTRGDFNQDGFWAADDLTGFIDAFVRG